LSSFVFVQDTPANPNGILLNSSRAANPVCILAVEKKLRRLYSSQLLRFIVADLYTDIIAISLVIVSPHGVFPASLF
jgi:hypothetical protein